MDSGAALHRYHRLAGISPSTSPLGERNKWSRQTTLYIDSHTMGDHEDEIPKLPSSLHEVEEEGLVPTYDPSLDIPTHSGYDPSSIGRRYWMSDDETHHEPTSTSYISYCMSGIPTHDPTQHAESEFEPNTTPRGIPIHGEIWEHESHCTLHPDGRGYITRSS